MKNWETVAKAKTRNEVALVLFKFGAHLLNSNSKTTIYEWLDSEEISQKEAMEELLEDLWKKAPDQDLRAEDYLL